MLVKKANRHSIMALQSQNLFSNEKCHTGLFCLFFRVILKVTPGSDVVEISGKLNKKYTETDNCKVPHKKEEILSSHFLGIGCFFAERIKEKIQL